MKNKLLLALVLSTSALFAQPVVSLQQYVTGFTSPVDITNCGDERLFVVERSGYIRIIDGQGMRLATAFLDIDNKVIGGGNEQGLLGLAFHPDYFTNGYFFVYYVNNSGDLVIARYSVTSNRDVADPNSESIVLTIPHPGQTNHNGGNLEFGPDGYLYIATGDGGGGGDPDNNSQDPLSLLGKMLRIDVDTLPYTFPPDNPYFGFASTRNEIWARGLRNPWRFSFDRLTGDMWIGDVGQGAREEVNFQPASSAGGENYGWRCYEGNTTYNTSGCGASSNYTFPVFDYLNSNLTNGLGCSVVGGHVYRGCKYPDLYGYYLFTDYCSGRFWEIHDTNGSWATSLLFDNSNFRYSAFGEDTDGELYVTGLSDGIIYKVVENSTATIIVNGSTTFCPGDSVMLSAPAGYSNYQWLKDGLPLATGTQYTAKEAGLYSVQLTGAIGCTFTTPDVQVIHHQLPQTPLIIASSPEYCAGDSVQLTTGSYSTYLWSDGATSATNYVRQGSYNVTVTDANGCSAASINAIVITENTLPVPVIQQTGTLCGAGSSAELSTTESFASYVWSSLTGTATTTITQPGSYDVTVTDTNGCEGVSAPFTVTAQTGLTPSFLGIVANDLNVSFCDDDTIVIQLTESYATYLWSNGAATPTLSVSETGLFWVEVSDTFGCTGVTDTLATTVIPAPAPTVVVQRDSICPGDSVQLSLSGNFNSYVWSTGETLPAIYADEAGAYSAIVVNNGCLGYSDTVLIAEHAVPTPVLTSSNGTTICSGASTVLDVSGNYVSYMWSTGQTSPPPFTVSTQGTYSITVTDDAGCMGADTIEIALYPVPTPEIFQGDSVRQCGDGVIELFLDSVYTKHYWSRGDSTAILFVISSGHFNVTVEDANGCVGVSDSIVVEIFPNPPAPEIEVSLNLGVTDSGFAHYQWYHIDGLDSTYFLVGDTFQDFEPLESQNVHLFNTGVIFFVIVTDSNKCSVSSDSVAIYWEGIEETWLESISLQPNPFTDEIVLNYTLKDLVKLRICLKDLAGKEIAVIADEKKGAGSYILPINTAQYQLSKGIYFLEVANGNSRKVLKLVKM